MSLVTKEQALELLIKGNERFAAGKPEYPNQDKNRRLEGLNGQKPFAVIIGCADSRIPPEILFDQGIGDLFVLRVAGNIVDDAIMGSIEYAVDHLGTSLVMVLGHNLCGAVQAAIEGGKAPGCIGTLIEAIQPAVDAVPADAEDRLDKVIHKNVELMVEKLKNAGPILNNSHESGKTSFLGGYYDMTTGKLTVL